MKSYNKDNYLRHKSDINSVSIPLTKETNFRDMSREELIYCLLPVVYDASSKFSMDELAIGRLTIEDIIQEGYIGLIESVDLLDLEKVMLADNPEGYIRYYVYKRVWGSIRRATINNRGTMRVSEYGFNKAIKNKDKDMAKKFFDAIFDSLDDNNNQIQVEDKIIEYDINFVSKYLFSLINKYLDVDEIKVLDLSYGLNGIKKTMPEIASQIGIDIKGHYKKITEIKKGAINKLHELVDPELIINFI